MYLVVGPNTSFHPSDTIGTYKLRTLHIPSFSLSLNIPLCLRLRVLSSKPHISLYKPNMLKKNTNNLLQINNYYLTLQQILGK